MNPEDAVIALNLTVDTVSQGIHGDSTEEDLLLYGVSIVTLGIFGKILAYQSPEFRESAEHELARLDQGEEPNRG